MSVNVSTACESSHLPMPGPLGLQPSFGYGDRLGRATPGHVRAARASGIAPVFAQQSIREMSRTNRMPQEVMQAARDGLATQGWQESWSADADHLKTEADIERMAEAGFCWFTIDPSDLVDADADRDSPATLQTKHRAIRNEVEWLDEVTPQHLRLETGTVVMIDQEALTRTAVKYGRAINRAVELASFVGDLHERQGRACEIELSIDETDYPTSLAAVTSKPTIRLGFIGVGDYAQTVLRALAVWKPKTWPESPSCRTSPNRHSPRPGTCRAPWTASATTGTCSTPARSTPMSFPPRMKPWPM